MMTKSQAFLQRHGRTFWAVTTVALAIAALTCTIVNYAVSRTIDWALYPILSVALAWVILSLFFLGGNKGVLYAGGAACLLVFPFLMLLDIISPVHGWAKAIGFPSAAAGIVYLAAVYAIIFRTKWNWWVRAGLIVLGAIPVTYVVQFAVWRYMGEAMHWSTHVNALTNLSAGAVLLAIGIGRKKVH